MATAASHGQCYTEAPLGQPLPTSTQRKHTLGKKRVPLRKRVVLHHALRVQSQAGFGRGTVKIKEEESLIEVEPEPEGGKKNFIKLPGTVKLQGTGQPRSKDNKVVFVAGATGKVGSRTVRELLKLGFQVRASTRNVEKAEALLKNASADAEPEDTRSFAIFSPAKLFGFLKPKPGKMLEIVKCDLEDAESIEPALGNAGVVVCCIGASEKEVLDVTGPYRIDFKATQNLIYAACAAQVNHFVLLTSLGTQKFGFPAAVLNLFWGVLVWKAKAEKALIQCGLPYTIVRPGGMERPTDAYKETHNLTLAEADKLFGGQVSNLQVAELIASIVENQDVSINKIVEAVAETTAPLRPIRELLEAIPASDEKSPSADEPQSTKKARPSKVDVSVQKISKKQEEKKIAEERRIQAQKDEEAKRIEAQKDKEARLKLKALREKYEKEIQAAKEKEEAAKTASMAALAEKAELERRAAEIRAKAEAAALAARQAKALEAAVLAAARKGNVLSDEEKKKILESVKLERLQKVKSSEEIKVSSKKTPAFSFFGRLAPSTTVTETSTDTELSGAQSTAEAKKEKERADAEARAKADEEAAAKLAAEKQLEEKEKKEEAKRLAEQEAARALEAKKKEEQEAARALEAKKKEEQEAARALEAKKKEEQEKAEKEAKELAEQAAAKAAEAKRNEEEEKAETKRKEEQEKAEKLKKEAENKAKALAEQEAGEAEKLAKEKAEQEAKDVKEAAVASAPAPQKGFRWFWQPAEPEPSELEPSAEFASTGLPDVLVDTKTIELPPSSTRLSPYTRFPELRPPSTPIPSPPTLTKKTETSIETPSSASSMEENAGESIKTILLEDVAEKQDGSLSDETAQEAKARKKLVMETVAREKEALEKAKSATAFLWPWQKQESEPQPAEQSENALTLPASDQVGKQETQTLPPSSRPLSPYTMFPGLKPPSPPIPSPPVLQSETVAVPKVELVSSEVNRVEQAIEKVKLPGVNSEKDKEAVAEETSEESKEDIEARKLLVQEVAAREKEALEKAKAASAFMWPWQKPKPAEEQSPPPSKEAGKPESETLPASSRPLSPYTQFPNLKPPTPPAPSPPMQNTIAEEPKASSRSSTPLSPYPGFPDLKPPPSPDSLPVKTSENGAVPVKKAGTDENILEPSVSSGFKWPWQ